MVVERVQALSHHDLRRLIPRLFPSEGAPCWVGTHCTIDFQTGQQLRLEMAPEVGRTLGALRIVSTPLRLIFDQWPEAERQVVLRRLEQAFQQGGG